MFIKFYLKCGIEGLRETYYQRSSYGICRHRDTTAGRGEKSPRLSGPEAVALYNEVSKLVNDSGLFNFPVKLHPHFFRHNLAVYLRDELKWDPREIQLILRHTSVETTTQFYFHDVPRNPEEYEF